MGLFENFSRDLRRSANNGTSLKLKNGTTVAIKATSFRGLEEIERAFPSWLAKLFRYFEGGGGVNPAQISGDVEDLLRDLGAAVPDWRLPLVFILADSNPDLNIDEEWLRENLALPDIRRIFQAWIVENELVDFIDGLKKKATEYLTGSIAKVGASSET